MPVLTVGCTFSDRIEALLDGRVGVEGVTLDIHVVEAQRLFRHVLREAAFDVAELSMASYIAALGRGRHDYLALPIFLSRSFRHSNLYVRTDRITRPEQLAGARIGVIDYQQTAALWVRGLLADDHGVARETIDWVAAGLHAPVLDDRSPLALPAGIRVRRVPETLNALLRAGALDAVISPTAPRCHDDPAVPVARLWPDPVAAELDYWRRTGIFPIMHVLVLRRSLAEADPALPGRLFAAFEEARRLAAADLATRDFPKVIMPWLPQAAKQAMARLGTDPWRYGIEANRDVLATMIRYAVADGLLRDAIPVEALFA